MAEIGEPLDKGSVPAFGGDLKVFSSKVEFISK